MLSKLALNLLWVLKLQTPLCPSEAGNFFYLSQTEFPKFATTYFTRHSGISVIFAVMDLVIERSSWTLSAFAA